MVLYLFTEVKPINRLLLRVYTALYTCMTWGRLD